MNIYVGNLSYQISDEQLRDAFRAFGEVESARIIIDRESGSSKGFGFVNMPERNQAMAAIEGLGGTTLGGRPLMVNEARPRVARNNRGGYNSGGARHGNTNGGGYNSGGARHVNANGGGYTGGGARRGNASGSGYNGGVAQRGNESSSGHNKRY